MHLTNINTSSNMFIHRRSYCGNLVLCKQHRCITADCDCDSENATAVCPWTDRCHAIWGEAVVSLTQDWKQNTQNPFCHTASSARGASVCSHLSTASRVIMGCSAQIRTYKHTQSLTRWNKQLAREPTNHASSNFNWRHYIWSESELSRTCCSHRVNSRRCLQIPAYCSLIYN